MIVHTVLTMAKWRLVRPIPKPWLGGPPPSRSLGSTRGSCGRSMSFRSSRGISKGEKRRANRDGRRAKGQGPRGKGEGSPKTGWSLESKGRSGSRWRGRRCKHKKGGVGWAESSVWYCIYAPGGKGRRKRRLGSDRLAIPPASSHRQCSPSRITRAPWTNDRRRRCGSAPVPQRPVRRCVRWRCVRCLLVASSQVPCTVMDYCPLASGGLSWVSVQSENAGK